MSWIYSGDPSSSAKDAVRFLIGDTNIADKILQDQEIEYFLTMYNNSPLDASIRCCEAVMTKFARLVNQSVGQVRVDYGDKVKQYQEMVQALRERLFLEGANMPFAGGISRTQKQQNDANTDRVKPDFSKHMMEDHQVSPNVTSPNGREEND